MFYKASLGFVKALLITLLVSFAVPIFAGCGGTTAAIEKRTPALKLSDYQRVGKWIKFTGTSYPIYLDSKSIRFVGEDIVRVATMSYDPGGGYTIVLGRYSLHNNALTMDALLTYSKDHDLVDWQVLERKTSFLPFGSGETFKTISPGADGEIIIAYLKEMARQGLIPY